MGVLKKIKKAIKGSVKNMFRGGSMWKFVDKYAHKPVTKKLQDMLGIGALKDMAAGQEESLRRQGEAAKLDSMNEVQNVTQFDDGGGEDFTGGGSRRKKRQSGAFSSGIGLNY